jgi:hypothetical protein
MDDVELSTLLPKPPNRRSAEPGRVRLKVPPLLAPAGAKDLLMSAWEAEFGQHLTDKAGPTSAASSDQQLVAHPTRLPGRGGADDNRLGERRADVDLQDGELNWEGATP